MEGVYRVDEVFYKELPMFSWYDIFTFSNLNPVTGAKWTKSGKEKHPVGYKDKFSNHVVKSLRLK